MNKQSDHKSFWALIVTQFLAAFNDNVFQIVTVLLVIRWLEESTAKSVVAASGIIFSAPFLLFSLVAGRLADRYGKSRILILTKTLDLGIVTLSIAGMYLQSPALLLTGLFLLGLQSTFFSPAKFGILPELMTEAELPYANGLLNGASFVAILTGTIAGSFLSQNINLTAMITALIALGSFGGSLMIKGGPGINPTQKIKWNPLVDFTANWKFARENAAIRFALIAVSYFWFMGGVVHLNALVYVKMVLRLEDKASGLMLGALVIGIALGSYLAGKFSRERVRLGFVPMGAIGMGLFTMDLFFSGSLPRTLVDAGMMGLSAGFYVVPLNTLLQVQSPPQERGRVISTGNFLSFLAIIIASGFLWLAGGVFHMTPAHVFLVCGILSMAVAARCWYQLKKKDSGLTW